MAKHFIETIHPIEPGMQKRLNHAKASQHNRLGIEHRRGVNPNVVDNYTVECGSVLLPTVLRMLGDEVVQIGKYVEPPFGCDPEYVPLSIITAGDNNGSKPKVEESRSHLSLRRQSIVDYLKNKEKEEYYKQQLERWGMRGLVYDTVGTLLSDALKSKLQLYVSPADILTDHAGMPSLEKVAYVDPELYKKSLQYASSLTSGEVALQESRAWRLEHRLDNLLNDEEVVKKFKVLVV